MQDTAGKKFNSKVNILCALKQLYLQSHVVLILPQAVVGMQAQFMLSQCMVGKEVVQEAYHSVGSLTCAGCFIDQVIYLSWDSFTAHPKDGTFPSCLKVHRPRLEGVVWVVDLLGKVKGVVDTNRPTPRWHIGANGRRGGVVGGKVLPYCIFAFLHHSAEIGPLTHRPQEVSLSCFQCLRVM